MRQLTFVELTPQELDELSATHPQGNFQQNSLMGSVHAQTGAELHYLGVREGAELVAGCIMEVHRSRLSTFATVSNGPLCDFHDRELSTFFLDNLRVRAKKAGAAQLDITPEVVYQTRDSYGNALPEGDEPWPQGVPRGRDPKPDAASFDTLTSCGFVHAGFDRTNNPIPRWRYLKDLTGIENEKQLLDSYAKNTKRNVRIAETSCVSVHRARRDELGAFHSLCELSSEKQGFDNRPLEYFQLIYDRLGDTAEFYLATIDAAAYLASLEKKLDGFEADIARLNGLIEKAQAKGNRTDKHERTLTEVVFQRDATLERIDEAKTYLAQDGEVIPAAGALFVWHPRECVYLFSGNNPKYARFCATSAIQHRLMCSCIERGYTRYNFYGVNGIFDDPSDAGRGLLEFKQGFGGYVEEMIGSFTLPVKPVSYALKQLGHKVLGR